MSIKPTEEQLAIVEASKNMSENSNVLKVEAYSGSGKTSTLVQVSEANLVPSLYLTFNKAMALEAAEKFPPHVECRTIHSIAYQAFGRDLQHKLSRPKGMYRNVAGTASEIALYYKVKPVFTSDQQCVLTSTYVALLAKMTVDRYEFSKSEHLVIDFVPSAELREKQSKFPDIDFKEIRKTIHILACKLWNDRKDPMSVVLSTHDTYLKLYQLSKPQLHFDLLYIDESNDVSPVMMDIVLSQSCKKIFVGDSRQSIYQFRGAVNALGTIVAPSLPLTRSFRFGQSVADLANMIIDPKKPMTGTGNTEVIEAGEIELKDLPKGTCMLFRTNMGVFLTAIDLISQGFNVDVPNNVGDTKAVITSALALKAGDLKKVKHVMLIKFSTWSEFEEAAKDDPELKGVYNLTKGSEAQLKRSLAILNSNDPSDAQYVLRTGHGAKGLEWDSVIVMNDFADDPEVYLSNAQEANLLYVATTRCKNKLWYNTVVKGIPEARKMKEMREDLFRISKEGHSEPRADMANFMLEQTMKYELPKISKTSILD